MIAPRLAIALAACALMAADGSYQTGIAEWRRARESRLKAEDGWLAVAGLFWLREGANRFGRDPSNDIVLPDGPPAAGVFELRGGKVKLTLNGATRDLQPDGPDPLSVGRLKLLLIKRGDRYGIRLKDPDSKARREFHGLSYFPVDERYRIPARFVSEPRKIPILNVLGQTEMSECPGYAVFQLNGKEYRLYPILEAPGARELFYIFRDLTAGKETYPAGRFLYSDLPQDGRVTLDFNKAYNPPCAFTDYATCPLPPKENRLNVRIQAGEKKFSLH